MRYTEIPPQHLKQVLDYDSLTGLLHWKTNPIYLKRWNTRYSGMPIRCTGSHGYVCFNLSYGGRKHHLLAHRVIFCMENGRWPREMDHINGIRNDNRIQNLRECNSTQNKINIKVRYHNKQKLKGVCRGKDKLDGTPRYLAYTAKSGKTVYLGTFPTQELAKAAYDNSVKKLYGKFFRP